MLKVSFVCVERVQMSVCVLFVLLEVVLSCVMIHTGLYVCLLKLDLNRSRSNFSNDRLNFSKASAGQRRPRLFKILAWLVLLDSSAYA